MLEFDRVCIVCGENAMWDAQTRERHTDMRGKSEISGSKPAILHIYIFSG
jgi:hypothetical protein